MALYKHVASKDELLDGMVDLVLGDIAPPGPEKERDWRQAVRARILASRRTLLGHDWVPDTIATRTLASPVVLDHMNALMGLFRSGGLSVELTHHAMHALSVRMWGFTREVFPTPAPPEESTTEEAGVQRLAARYPYLLEVAAATAPTGCDSQVEFELALDVLLDGFERLHRDGWDPPVRSA